MDIQDFKRPNAMITFSKSYACNAQNPHDKRRNEDARQKIGDPDLLYFQQS